MIEIYEACNFDFVEELDNVLGDDLRDLKSREMTALLQRVVPHQLWVFVRQQNFRLGQVRVGTDQAGRWHVRGHPAHNSTRIPLKCVDGHCKFDANLIN